MLFTSFKIVFSFKEKIREINRKFILINKKYKKKMNNNIIEILNLFQIEICKLKNLINESISQEQIDEFKHLFQIYDQNGQGFINKQDFKLILSMTRSFDLKPNDYEIDLLVFKNFFFKYFFFV